jgi:type II secretory pathway pseudopilin PulG
MRAPDPQAGFTYLGILMAIAIMGLLLTLASRVWSFSAQRDKEAELLWVGDQYRMAISAYFAFGHQYPQSLQDLLTDKRTPVPRHYLRQLYRDPLMGNTDWMLLMDPTGIGIMGVASKSKLKPIKRTSFSNIEIGFDDRDCYCDWKFIYVPRYGWYPRASTVPPLGPTTPPPGSTVPPPGQ